jgi:serine/threonine-protein kinase
MYRFCERCERETHDGNLWCQDPDCPAERGYTLLQYGDYLGDLKVTKFVRVWRTAALYEAEREGQPVMLKVANAGDFNAERLRREATLLSSISPQRTSMRGRLRSFMPTTRPQVPVSLPPYPYRSQRSYGEISFRGEVKIFSVFEHVEGKVLADILLETPQLWHTHAAWIAITLARSLRPLAARNLCHLSLTPDVILLEFDEDGVPRPTLMDLGFVLDVHQSELIPQGSMLWEPAYTAPELLAKSPNGALSLAADVYSLGMIFYEMLAGHPGFESKLHRDAKLSREILQIRQPVSAGRPELEQSGISKVLDNAISPTERYNNVVEFSRALQEIYSSPPPERRKIPSRLYLVLGAVALVLLALGVIAALTLLQVISGP